MLTSWYFVWFTFWIVILTALVIFFCVVVQPFTVAIESFMWVSYCGGVVFMMERRCESLTDFSLTDFSFFSSKIWYWWIFFYNNYCLIYYQYFFYYIIKLSKLNEHSQVNNPSLNFIFIFIENVCSILTLFFYIKKNLIPPTLLFLVMI